MTSVYLDHNSTSPLRDEVREYWIECLRTPLGNASSLHASGRHARHLVDEARERVANALGVQEDEVLFTASGTESNNLAIWGTLGAAPDTLCVTSEVEHSSVLDAAHAALDAGHRVEFVPPDREGRVAVAEVGARVAAAGPRALVSLQVANNETGTVQAIATLRETVGTSCVIHTDAVQALGRVPLPLRDWGIDLASFSAHKVGGPLGVGVLYRRNGAFLRPLMQGGGQELGLRPGTENAAAIAASGLAIELAVREQCEASEGVRALAHELWSSIASSFDGVELVGPPIDSDDRLPNTVTILLPGTDGKVLVTALDLAGLEVSAGSACSSGSIEPSHVLRAMQYDDDRSRAGLRLSLGRTTTRDDCKRAVEILRKVVGASRAT